MLDELINGQTSAERMRKKKCIQVKKDAEFFTVFMYSIISQAFCVIALRGSVMGREKGKKNKGPVR